MVKKITVKCCDECPYLSNSEHICLCICIHIKTYGNKIKNTDVIPEWCLLEDE